MKKRILLAKVRPVILEHRQLPLELGLEFCLYNRAAFYETIQNQWKLLGESKGFERDLLYHMLECNYLSFLHPSLSVRNLNRLRLIKYGARWSSLVSNDPTTFLSYIILPKIHFSVEMVRVTSESDRAMIPESFTYTRYKFNVKGLRKYLNLPSSYKFVDCCQLPEGIFRIDFATSRKGDCRIESYLVPESVVHKYCFRSSERLCFLFEAALLWIIEVDDFIYEDMWEEEYLIPSVFIDKDCLGCDYDFCGCKGYVSYFRRFFMLGCQYFPKESGFNYYIIKDYEGEADELNYLAMNKFDFNDFYQGIEFRNKTCAKIKKELDSYDNWRSKGDISI